MHQQNQSSTSFDRRNRVASSMSTVNCVTATNNDNSAVPPPPIDLIESKFDELAKKILDELKQSNHHREFFQAIDMIISEPPVQQQDIRARRTKQQQRRTKRLNESAAVDKKHTRDNDDDENINMATNLELRRQFELIMEKQQQQQEQLNNHQQILFDSQYRSLPVEITEAVAGHEQRRANAKISSQNKAGLAASQATSPSSALKETSDNVGRLMASKQPPSTSLCELEQPITAATNTKTNPVKASPLSRDSSATMKREAAASNKDNQRQRSAIPQSTILSGISQKFEGASAYPIIKSATVGSGNEVSSNASGLSPSSGLGLVRQASLRLNKQTREAQQEFIQHQTRPLAASEKLKQRRPTKANLLDQRQPTTDDSDDDLYDDDDDDDDEFEYQNLASRRAYLNQRFISQHQQQQREPVMKAKELGVASSAGQQQGAVARHRQQVTSTIQSGVKQAASVNTANMTVSKQKQRFSGGNKVVRSSTIGANQMTRPTGGDGRQLRKKGEDEATNHEQSHEPRSLGGLLTSHDIGQLYKPHMNYSTSLLGNHRLSDDDEIIIIPTAQSPSLLSTSVSPVGREQQHQHQQQADDQHTDRTTTNMDEFSERFSISRTKSFWEKLAHSKGGTGEEVSKCQTGASPQQDKQYFNSSQRSLSSGPNLVADSKSSQCSLLNQSGLSGGGQPASANGHHHYPAAMKGAFDRMDSTGGSGNSHYSGCSSSSSTSGDETINSAGGPLSLAERRAMLASAAAGGAAAPATPAARQRGPTNASMNPTINQLVQQDQINRSDRFRQTR